MATVNAKGVTMARKILAFTLSIMVLAPLNNSFAADTALITAGNGATSCGGAPKNYNYSQRIIAGASLPITKVMINLAAALSTDYVEIRATDAIGISGTLIGTLTYSSNSAVNTYFATTFTGSVPLTSGSQYWLILRGSTADSICFDTTTYTSSSSFDFVKSGASYQWSFGSSAFTYASHWSMNIYTGEVDTTPPTFPSADTFSISENQSSIGTITTSEPSTISIFAGADQNKFSLSRIDSVSASLSFITAPNYEVPTDSGADNVYQVVFRAVDIANNSGYETVTVTVTDIDENAKLISFTITGAKSKGQISTLVATVSAVGKVTFLANGKRIAGCINKATAGSTPITATCQWKPATKGEITLTFNVVPSASNYFATTSLGSKVFITSRTNNR